MLARSIIRHQSLHLLYSAPLLALATLSAAQATPRRLSLDQAGQLAILQSPAVFASQADILAAREATRSAAARRRPTLSANGFATAGNYGSIYPSSPRVDPAYSLLAPSGTLLDANLMAMAPLLTGGLLDSEVRSARSLEAALTLDLREAQADAALRAEDAYLRSLLASADSAAASSRVDAGAELVRTTRASFEAGKGIEASVRRAQAELAQGQRALTKAEGEREKAVLDLKAETGIDADEAVELGDPLDVEGPVEDAKAAVAAALKNRGAVLAARARVEAASSGVRAAEAAGRPQLYGVAMADAASQSGSRGGSLGLTLSVPLLDGGSRRAETGRARAMRERALATLRQVETTVQKEVRQSYVDLATADSNVRSARESVLAAQASYDVAALRVSSGKAPLVEQLDSLQALTQARADLASALYDRRIARVRIARATGAILGQGAAK